MRRLSRPRSVRSEHGAFLVDGPVLLAEALDAGVPLRGVYVEADATRPEVRSAVARAEAVGARVRRVVPGALAKVLDLGTPQSVVAVVEQRPTPLERVATEAVERARPVLVLADLGDPGNVGTLVRTAEASGCAGVVLVGSGADLFNPKTVRATAGAVFRVPVADVADARDALEALRSAGLRNVATVGARGRPHESVDLSGAVAVWVGSEAHGLDAAVVERCDESVTVPMEGSVESLNAAVAGSLVAFEAARQRRSHAHRPDPAQRSGGVPTSVGHDDDPVATGPPRSGRPAPEHGSPPR